MSRPARVMWKVFEFVSTYKEENGGNPPTREDIARHFKFSPQAADQHLHRLHRKGYVAFDEHGRVVQVGGEYMAPEILSS